MIDLAEAPPPAAPRGLRAGAPARPVRVLCVTPSGPDGKGGIDRLYLYLREGGRLAEQDGVAVRYLASRGEAQGAGWIAAFPGRALAFAAALARFRPDLVHINFATGGSLVRKRVLAALARRAGCPVVLHFHGQFPLDGIARRDLSGRFFLSLCRAADLVIALGEVSRERFVAQAGVAPERLRVVPNGIPDFAAPLRLPKIAAAPGRPVRILFAGEVGTRKGVPVLIEALARLGRQGAWTCTVAGNGAVEACAAQARAAGLAERVRFTGWIPSGEVHRLMIEADIVVLPSEAENMPLSLIEGACAGAALVATPVAETRAVVRDGLNGVIVERDANSVARALAGLIDDPARLGRMQAASRHLYAQHFTLEALAERLRAVYAEVAGPG